MASERIGRAVLELVTDSKGFKADIAAIKREATQGLPSAFKQTRGSLDSVAAGMSQAGKEASASGKMIAGMSQVGRQSLQAMETPTLGLTTKMVALGSAIGASLGVAAVGALSSLGSKLVETAKRGAEFSVISGSFDRLTQSIGQSGDAMLQVTRRATKGLIADLDIMKAANKAVLLDLPVTAQNFGHLSRAATVLGRAMGQDATKSLDDLITALGRSSPLILDNLGLTVKVGEANEAYAQQLGKTVSQLTEAEKKTAFYQAAMEAADRKVDELGGIHLKVSDQVGRLWTQIGNLVTRMASGANETGLFAESIGAIADAAQRAAENVSLLERARQRLRDQPEPKTGGLGTGFIGQHQRLLDTMRDIEREDVARQARDVANPLALPVPAIQATEKETKALEAASAKLAKRLEAQTAEHEKQEKALKESNEQLRAMVGWFGTSLPHALDKTRPLLSDFRNDLFELDGINLDSFGGEIQAMEGYLAALDKRLGDVITEAKKGPGVFGSFFGGLKGGLSNIWQGMSGGKGVGGLLSNIGTGLAEGFGNLVSGNIAGLVSQGIGLLGKGLSKLLHFGGPSQQELEGREVAENFRKGLIAGLNTTQLAEAAAQGNQQWAGSVIAIRDAYIDAGYTEREALNVADRLWRAEKEGAEAVKAVMGEIQGVFDEQAADVARLEEAVKRYGFSFEELGPKLQAQNLNAQAKELIEDWRVLNKAQIDIVTVNERMAESVSDYLQTALDVGAEIPAAMKPILQSMIDQGVLVDENGKAITDLEATGVKFAETMTEGFDRVVLKLQQLIDTLNGAGHAIQNIPRSVDVGVNYVPLNEDLLRGRNLESFAQAGFTPFGSGGIAMRPLLGMVGEAGPEAIVPLDRLPSVTGVVQLGQVVDAIGGLDRRMATMERYQRDLPFVLKNAVKSAWALR